MSTINDMLGGNDNIAKMLSGERLMVKDGVTAPDTNTTFAQIYVDTADGDLKIKFADGTVKTISADS